MKRTGGGAFRPDEQRPIGFGAGNTAPTNPCLDYVLVAVNDVFTESEARQRLDEPLEDGKLVLLDSGIFWMTNRHARTHNVSMDHALGLAPDDIDGFDVLYPRYLELVRRYEPALWGFMELDQGGADNKRRTRDRIEDESGFSPIPVYHPLNDGWDYFDELAASYDRLCLGNVVQAHHGLRTELLHTIWERRRAYPGLWIHALGLDVVDDLLAVPTDSCDATSWTEPLRWPWGIRPHAMLEAFGHTSRDFQYTKGAAHDEPSGRTKADLACAWELRSSDLNWREHWHRLEHELGPMIPPRHTKEPEPCAAPSA